MCIRDSPADTLNRLPKDKPDYGDFDEGTEEGARMPAVTLMFKLKCTDTVPIETLSLVEVGNGVYDCGNKMCIRDSLLIYHQEIT